jgi:hypothetical protein
MTVQLNIDYSDLLELVEQLSEEQQKDLIRQLLTHRARQRPLTSEEKIQLLDAAKLHNPVNETPSVRRVDWYDDNGR